MPPPPLRRPFSTRLPPSLGPSPSRRARPLRRRCRSRGRQAVAMALALQLRRALAAASTAAPLLHVPASVARSLSLTPSSASSVAPPLPRAPWWLRAGFRSTAARCRSDYGADVRNISPDEILFEGRDHNHSPWSFPTSRPSPRSSEVICCVSDSCGSYKIRALENVKLHGAEFFEETGSKIKNVV